MKIMTVNAQVAPTLRSWAEDRQSLGAVALGRSAAGAAPAAARGLLGSALGSALGQPVFAQLGGQQYALLAQLPAVPTTAAAMAAAPAVPAQAPAGQLNYLKQAELQRIELEYIAREFVLPGIKAAWPNASHVITGVEILWAAKDFWVEVADEKADTRKTAMAGVKLASTVAGLYLGATHAPLEAQLTNQFAGLIVATADKVYSAQIKARADA